jgi:imidazolonepropionase-like amidohydrolase
MPAFRPAFGAFLLLLTLACAPLAAESILITGAVIHTVSGSTLPAGQVLIKDGKIAAINTVIPGRADRVVKLDGHHLYPGLIALDTALGLVEIEGVRATRDFAESGEFTPDVQSWVAVNPDSELLPVARAAGITHFQPVPQGGLVPGQSALMALDGWTIEEMAVKKSAALHVYWPAMELTPPPTREPSATGPKPKSLDEQATERRAKLKSLDEFFEEARAYGKTTNRTAAPNPAWEAMQPVLAGQTPLIIHANEVRQIKAAVEWAGQRGYKIVLAGGRDAWMVAELLAAKQIPVIYAHVFTRPVRDTDSYDAQFKAPGILRQAGVKVLIAQGNRFEATMIRNLPYTAAQAIAFGLPADEALKAITLYPAQLLGVADRLGALEVGKEATLFACDGDLFDIRANVKRLWIAGKEQSLENRQTRLYEKYKARPRPSAKP